jgi:hypothetical protein
VGALECPSPRTNEFTPKSRRQKCFELSKKSLGLGPAIQTGVAVYTDIVRSRKKNTLAAKPRKMPAVVVNKESRVDDALIATKNKIEWVQETEIIKEPPMFVRQ